MKTMKSAHWIAEQNNTASPAFSERERLMLDSIIEAERARDKIPNRETVWAFEADGAFVRWCGTLEQFNEDCASYCDCSKGVFTRHSKYHVSFKDADTKETTQFRATKRAGA